MKKVFRGTAGGFNLRKLYAWMLASQRFRTHFLVGIAVFLPFAGKLTDSYMLLLYNINDFIHYLRKPRFHGTWNKPTRGIDDQGIVSFFPPSANYDNYEGDPYEFALYEVETKNYIDFITLNQLDIVRNLGLIHHPSRETNAVLEGAFYREDQNKISESIRVKLAEEGVKRGVWNSVEEALDQKQHIKKSQNRKLLYGDIETFKV